MHMKSCTICENHLFNKAYAKGKKAVCRHIVLYVLTDRHAWLLKKQNPQKEKINRVGITVSKKIGHAVQRNRAKRIIREAYWALEKNDQVKKGYLVVIVARDGIQTAKSGDIYLELKSAAAKVGLISC